MNIPDGNLLDARTSSRGRTSGSPRRSLTTLWLVALVGFALRYRRYGRDLDSWMCLAATLAVFADLHLVLTPVVSSDLVLQGDFLRVVAYGVLLVGVWRAISEAEFGRAVADERARVARDIHDGLAQYLFAISTQVSMLESGAPLEQVLRASSVLRRRRSRRRGSRFSRSRRPEARRGSTLAAPIHRGPDRRRSTRRRARRRPAGATRSRRADRGLPDRAGGPR